MIDITFDEIGEHMERGDLKEWLDELRAIDAAKNACEIAPIPDCAWRSPDADR